MLEKILKQRQEKYGDFKHNVQKMEELSQSFICTDPVPNIQILKFFLTLKMARLIHLCNQNKIPPVEFLNQTQEDSLLDLKGYALLIRQNYNTHKMQFVCSLIDDEATKIVKIKTNALLKGVE